jgi:phosphatidylserine/phosphatidylglycerophosphate/cardiolipin synthase-like enzyme
VPRAAVSAETGAFSRTVEAPAAAGTSIDWLIDNADAYRAIVRSVRGARHSIWISQLAIDADCLAYEVDEDDEGSRATPLAAELVAAARRGVQLRLLVNASLLLDTAAPLRAYFAAAGVPGDAVRVRGVSRFPQLLHAKIVVVDDDEAFLVGSPFANGYWDDSRHAPVDARRPARELGGRPLHDVSTRFTGAPVVRLARAFTELWNAAAVVEPGDDRPLAPPRAAGPVSDDAPDPVRIVRTAPARSTPGRRHGRLEILPALLDGIGRARSLIYIEHQYLSARPVIDALAEALRRRSALEIIIVLNQNPDVTAYRGWQNARLAESGLLTHRRVGLFALWSATFDPASRIRRINQVFVHSKVVVVDDRWATVGSANLDGVSLHSYGDDFSGAIGRRLFRSVRNFDVNAVIDAEEDSAIGSKLRSLRGRLWREHLGSAAPGSAATPGESVRTWRARAQGNAALLARGGAASDLDRSSFVLPYSTRSTPADQLADLGIRIRPSRLDLCFSPSWLEVHFSPNWVRNMFG